MSQPHCTPSREAFLGVSGSVGILDDMPVVLRIPVAIIGLVGLMGVAIVAIPLIPIVWVLLELADVVGWCVWKIGWFLIQRFQRLVSWLQHRHVAVHVDAATRGRTGLLGI